VRVTHILSAARPQASAAAAVGIGGVSRDRATVEPPAKPQPKAALADDLDDEIDF
jgi:hypothetical protein